MKNIYKAYRESEIEFCYFYQVPQPTMKLYAYCLNNSQTIHLNKYYSSWYLGTEHHAAVPYLYYHACHEWFHIKQPQYQEHQVRALTKKMYREV